MISMADVIRHKHALAMANERVVYARYREVFLFACNHALVLQALPRELVHMIAWHLPPSRYGTRAWHRSVCQYRAPDMPQVHPASLSLGMATRN